MTKLPNRTVVEWCQFAGVLTMSTVASFLIHEQGHYLMGTALGFDMWFNLNSAGTLDEPGPTAFQQTFITMAGPAITIVQALIASLLIKHRAHLWIYAFVITAFWQRTYAFATSMAISHNDEARIAVMYELPVWSIHSVTSGILLFFAIWAARKAKAGVIANLISYLVITLGMLAVVLGTQTFPYRFG